MYHIVVANVDDPAKMSEGIFDDARAVSGRHVVASRPNIDMVPFDMMASIFMAPSSRDFHVTNGKVDDPNEGHVVVSNGDDLMMMRRMSS